MRVRFVDWTQVATVHWNVTPGEVCGICQASFEESKQHEVPLWGKCSHVYHQHCINQWLSQKMERGQPGTCPMCRQMWRQATPPESPFTQRERRAQQQQS
ncbi:MAG: hypothetical protein MHM6MM_002019 [Cercozoa sp. M6MM]